MSFTFLFVTLLFVLTSVFCKKLLKRKFARIDRLTEEDSGFLGVVILMQVLPENDFSHISFVEVKIGHILS